MRTEVTKEEGILRSRKWRFNFYSKPSTKSVERVIHAEYPVSNIRLGHSSHLYEADSKRSNPPVPSTGIQSQKQKLLSKRPWRLLLIQIPMNLFIMFMSGSSISLIPLIMLTMMLVRQIQALFQVNQAFATIDNNKSPLSRDNAEVIGTGQTDQWLPKLVYLIGNSISLAITLYRCSVMGILPSSISDFTQTHVQCQQESFMALNVA
ncbi:hypothetical protein ACOME3_006580 [Neoechinorhynchus agilis]